MTVAKLRNACVRVSAFSAVATILLGALYVIGKTDALMILPLISATIALVAAIPAACETLFTRRGLLALAWVGGGLVSCVVVVGLLIPMT
jgi:hypothetical protein